MSIPSIPQTEQIPFPVTEMLRTISLQDERLAEQSRSNEERIEQLFAQMRQTIEQLTAENQNLRGRVSESETRYEETTNAHQREVRALNEEVALARNETGARDRLHQEELAALRSRLQCFESDKRQISTLIQQINQLVTGKIAELEMRQGQTGGLSPTTSNHHRQRIANEILFLSSIRYPARRIEDTTQ